MSTDATSEWRMSYSSGSTAVLEELVGGRGRRLRERLEDFVRSADPWGHPLMADQRGRRIDVVLDAMLRHHGVRPDAMTLLSLMHAVPELAHEPGGTRNTMLSYENVESIVRGAAWISPQVRWSAFRADRPTLRIDRSAVPDTIVAALPGRRLSTILSHPALDPLDLVVDEAGGTTQIEMTLRLPPHAWLHPDGAPTDDLEERKR